MKYKAYVDQGFIDMIGPKIANDSRGKEVASRQWSFEFPEYALGKIPSSGHTWNEGMEYDTVHPFFGKCDFKYHNKEGVISLTDYVYRNIEKGLIDTFITWKWLKRNPGVPLELGELVSFELIMYIDSDMVYNNSVYNREKARYEYICT